MHNWGDKIKERCSACEKNFIRRWYEDDRKVFLLHVYSLEGCDGEAHDVRAAGRPGCGLPPAQCGRCPRVMPRSPSGHSPPVYRTEREIVAVLRIRILQDPYVFGPPGSGTFYHQAKIVRKTLIPTVLDFFMSFYL
jgi:hypothetical protein